MRTALLILCLIGAPSPSPPHQETAKPAQSKPQTDAHPSKPAPSAVTEKQTTTNTPNQNGGNVTSNPNERAIRIVGYPPRSTGETVALWCTVILTAAAITGIVVAICTLIALRHQTEATKIAALAAKASADALIASERAWVVGELVRVCKRSGKEWFRPVETRWASLNEAEILDGYHTTHTLNIQNLGKTPAHILGYEIHRGYLVHGMVFTPDNLSNKWFENPHTFLEGGGTRVLREFKMDDAFPIKERASERNKTAALFISIKYGDVITGERQEHESSFVYLWSASNSSLQRISEHERYT